MPTCYILVGVPASGKSTWIKSAPLDWTNTVVASTDNYVEQEATKQGKTYSEVFHDAMPDAVSYMANQVLDAIKVNADIVWDQTSTTVATRAKKLRMLPPEYKTVAVVFPTPEKAELARRLGSRVGKNIPNEVMRKMISWWQDPTEDEGFDEIIHIT